MGHAYLSYSFFEGAACTFTKQKGKRGPVAEWRKGDGGPVVERRRWRWRTDWVWTVETVAVAGGTRSPLSLPPSMKNAIRGGCRREACVLLTQRAVGPNALKLNPITNFFDLDPARIVPGVSNFLGCKRMDTLLHVPPGFRFHPTDEELVDYYLRRKVASKTIDFDVVTDVDLYKIEPWDLQGVSFHLQEEGWVVCRVFKKRTTTVKRASDLESPCFYDDQVSLIHEIGSSPRRILQQEILYQPPLPCRQELENHYSLPQEPLQLPQLQSPTLSHSGSSNINGLGFGFDIKQGASPQMLSYEHQQQSHMSLLYDNSANQAADQVTDWRVLDKFVASQLRQENASEGTSFTDAAGFHLPDMNLLQQAK
ncbi:hypothetical protein EJ110_NYTH05150 [Nymphaea thermarum]|nr:hypothetical protein EJ110_NYTH05150 [Nymphaea thermarum]